MYLYTEKWKVSPSSKLRSEIRHLLTFTLNCIINCIIYSRTHRYGKPNQQSAVPTPVHQLISPTITALWRHAGGPTGDDAVLLHMSFPHDLVSDYGAPAAAELRLTFPSRMSPVQDLIEIELTLVNKTATRLGEAGFFSFNPPTDTTTASSSSSSSSSPSSPSSASSSWWMDKVGEWVSPLEVVDGGSKGLHGITRGVRFDRVTSDDDVVRSGKGGAEKRSQPLNLP